MTMGPISVNGCIRLRAHAHVAVCFAVAISLGCTAKEAEFYRKAFPCDLKAAPNSCGTTSDGKPMTCYPGHLLGGQDFCAAPCDPKSNAEDSRFSCLEPGALVQRCRPVAGRDNPAYACPEGLECYRTDLFGDDGLCLMIHVCTVNNDCQSNDNRQVCAGTIVRDLASPSALPVFSDSLWCIQNTCDTQSSNCPPDEGCLFNNYTTTPVFPDLCVPKCDSRPCPPNFSCAQKDSAPGAPALCIPGLPGVRCDSNLDCMVGECIDTGAGFRICTLPVPCSPAGSSVDPLFDYCAKLNSPADVFVCVEGIPGQPRCVTTRPFSGGNCLNSSECPADTGQQCFWYDAFQSVPDRGTCRVPCSPDGRCDPQGGIPFVCVGENREGGCTPTGFGLPCLDDSQCYGNLVCPVLGPDARSRSNYSPGICTTSCASDTDCDANPLTHKAGFCQTETGFCRLGGEAGDPCTKDTHCRSRRCNVESGCLP